MNETLLTVWLFSGAVISERVPAFDCHMLAMTAVQANVLPDGHMSKDGQPMARLRCGPYDITLRAPPGANQRPALEKGREGPAS